MSTVSTERDLAEPHLRETLGTAGLDVDYVRAEGNTLYHLDESGNEIPVTDFAGGYGSLLLGHNNPEIVARAKEILDARAPVHAQFSRNSHASTLAARLNDIVQREAGTDEPYLAIFANSGAEAIEAAVKHAELDRVLRVQALAEEIGAHLGAVRAAVAGGEAKIGDDAWARVGLPASAAAGGAGGIEELLAAVSRHNEQRLTGPPVFLTLEGGFHGKLMGSVQLTHNPAYRTPFAALGAQARFVPLGRPGAVREAIEAERATVLDLVVDGGVVRVVERDFPSVCAFLLEPIQGEGGIVEVTPELAQEIQRECAAIDCPVVVDEIQSGMGRTGAFLAASSIGLRGDYYTLAKSLGGGLAKISVMLVRQTRYRKEFELLHSSTFAKDGFSGLVAHRVLDLLEADGGRLYGVAAERGNALKSMLEGVRADFPEVVKDVRGRGLMLGMEFHDQATASAPGIAGIAQAGFLGYALSGHLLRGHRIRTFPTASAVNTLRFEPSVYLSDAEIQQLETGLRSVAAILRDQDEQRFFQP
ncbi:aspartate aminotransferase family protein [Streptomyces sp. NPDC090127]|uniref:aspartate aminotransferase family protein n=1 Tax=Streptomyces sp. NPDC090127 TaxID=3365953 RepID=UPI0037F9C1CA